MKIVFFGTSSFSASLLEHLVLNVPQHRVVAVVSRPDSPKGRGQKCCMTPVHEVAERLVPNVLYLQPQKASSIEVIEHLKTLKADIFVVVAYGEIVTKALLDIPPKGCVNVHASLLPLLRGAAPIHRAIMQGFSHTGVTIMRMDEGMDTGDMILKKEVSIRENDCFDDVEKALLEAAKIGLVEALEAIEAGTVEYTQQNHAQATKASKVVERDLCLDVGQDVRTLHNMIRALSPKPGAYFQVRIRNKSFRLKVLKSTVISESRQEVTPSFKTRNGELVFVNTSGELLIQEVQLEGKARMPSKEFVRGYPLPDV